MKTENHFFIESLTKENFWNDLHEKYPNGVQIFCDWIDEYKKRVEWNRLFNGGIQEHAYLKLKQPKFTIAPKYHDLPYAIQIGIWIQFVTEKGGCQWEIGDLFTHDWVKDITEYLRMLHETPGN